MVRLKYRYIIGQVILDNNNNNNTSLSSSLSSSSLNNENKNLFNNIDIQNIIREKILSLFGDFGYGSFGLTTFLKYLDNDSFIYIIRTPREHYEECIYATMCISEIKKIPIILRTLKVASCIRTCKDNLDIYLQRYINSNEYLNDKEKQLKLSKLSDMLIELEL